MPTTPRPNRPRQVDAKGRVILPDKFAGQQVIVSTVSDTEVRITIARSPRRRPSLTTLLSRVTASNLPERVDFGLATGEEQL